MILDTSDANQSAELQLPRVPAKPSFDVRLTAVSSGARIIRVGGNTLEVQPEQMVDVQVDEGIEVVNPETQDEQNYSILDFSDDLEVELFSNTSVVLADLRQQAGGSTYVNLHLSRGHIFVHLNDQQNSGITVQTLYATIRTLTSGAEFDVCQNQELTCILVKKGVVEVTPQQGKNFLVKVGEAVSILKGQRPLPPICAPLSKFTNWEEKYRQFAGTPALDTEIAALPQESCHVNAAGIPVHGRILYKDEFWNPFSGWDRGRIGNFNVRYAGLQYYRVQAQQLANQFSASVPNEIEYGDVNIDLRAISESTSSLYFRYGIFFRRTGDQYYAFLISPVTKTWYFLKSSSAGQETLIEGTDDRMRGFESKETLRVESYGSTFLLYINDRLMDWVSDPDYASGEVGLFVDAMGSPDAIIRFDSIVIWDMPQTVTNPNPGREYCFNTFDDDADGLIDRSDPDCQRAGHTATPPPTKSSVPATKTLKPTQTLKPTNTTIPNTSTLQPTNTSLPPTSQPTDTSIPPTRTRRPTTTPTPVPPDTNTPVPPDTNTPIPPDTNTPIPPDTETPPSYP